MAFLPVLTLKAQTLPTGFADVLVLGNWVEPVGATWDANGRMYVWEKRGMVWIVENGVKLPNPLIDIRPEVGNWRDHGYLGFALDPNFLTNGRIYMMYAVDRHHLMNFGTGSYNASTNQYYAATIMRITRYTAIGPNFNTVDYNSRFVLVGETPSTGIPLLHESHSTGSLMFGRDGTLLATTGDGASYSSIDVGSAGETYYAQALTDGIIRPEENVGSMRSQMVNSLNGKVLRLDPNTGNGVPSNPWYDPAAPRAPRSRVFALGLRNPFRATIKPNSGSTNPNDARPGTLYIGDVGWNTWEDLHVCTEAGQNFGWPLFEGMTPHTGYTAALTENRDAPNPLYNGTTCNIPYFRFQDLLKQETPIHLNAHPNPCNSAIQIPASIPKHFHSRPPVDWRHGNQSRYAGWNGTTPVAYDLDSPSSPVQGPRFGGYSALAGPWISGSNWPAGYQGATFHGDYDGGFIRRFMFDANDQLTSVHNFASDLGGIVWMGVGPEGCLYYIRYDENQLRRICYTQAVNLPPVAVAVQSVQYGPGPLTVNFTGSGSSDPENGAITYLWNFGNGQTSTQADPTQVFTAPPGVPTTYNVTLTVTDNVGQTNVANLIVSVNNTPPNVAIVSFPNGAFYPVGVDTVYSLQASVSDAEHGPAQLTYAWRTTLYHNTHTHPEAIDNNVSTSTVISGVGCDSETYWYGVELKVTDAGGLSTSVTHYLYPRCHAIPPTAVITASATYGASPLPVNFSGTQSFDPGTIVAYHWDFGDGTSSTSPSPSKTFTETGPHVVTLTVTDNDGLTGQATIVVNVLTYEPPQCVGALGSIRREYFAGIGGTAISDLLNSPNYPNNPTSTNQLTSFQGPTNLANSYGTRVRGYLVPTQTGNYTFTVTSDDNSAVYLSPNANPALKQLICSVPGWTNATEYNKYPQQVSAAIPLVAGRYYYVELLHKEGSGGDHFALRWQTPSNNNLVVIPGSVMAPWQDCPPGVVVRMNLQGPWDNATAQMKDDLRAGGWVPLTEPYTGLGFAHAGGGGGESTTAARLAQTGKNAVVDWVMVELRNKNNPAQLVATRCALLERDGDVVGTNGYARLNFNVAADNYYIAVRHRNHLGVMTQNSVALGAQETGVDFTLPGTPTYGSEARAALQNGKRASWAGNTVRDGLVRYTGTGNDRDPILVAIGGTVPTATITGYRVEDVNLDGTVKYTGQNNDRDPILQNIGGVVPTSTRPEQLP